MTTWTTRTGERIRLQDMTDLHLTNAIKLTQRKLEAAQDEMDASFSAGVSGEMATYYAEGAQAEASATVAGLALQLRALEDERKHRKREVRL